MFHDRYDTMNDYTCTCLCGCETLTDDFICYNIRSSGIYGKGYESDDRDKFEYMLKNCDKCD